jgi:hypothetical protein
VVAGNRDVPENIYLGFRVGRAIPVARELGSEGEKQTIHGGVVQALPLAGHAADYPMGMQHS